MKALLHSPNTCETGFIPYGADLRYEPYMCSPNLESWLFHMRFMSTLRLLLAGFQLTSGLMVLLWQPHQPVVIAVLISTLFAWGFAEALGFIWKIEASVRLFGIDSAPLVLLLWGVVVVAALYLVRKLSFAGSRLNI
jgi:hypothetical protein